MLQSMDEPQLNVPRTRNVHNKSSFLSTSGKEPTGNIWSASTTSRLSGHSSSRPQTHNNAITPRKFTPRHSPRNIRSVASTPVLRPSAAKRMLRPRGSRLDLLDKSKITSFPSPYRPMETSQALPNAAHHLSQGSPHASHSSQMARSRASSRNISSNGTPHYPSTPGSPLSSHNRHQYHLQASLDTEADIIDDYVPRPLRRDSEMFGYSQDAVPQPGSESWTEYLWKKLRWRWRVQGLLH